MATQVVDQGKGAEGEGGDPKRVRLHNWLTALGLVIVPLALLLLYTRAMFDGLVNSDAMDFAQLGRNISSGQGFVTYVLRPLALPGGTGAINPLQQPDVTHGPLYPLVLALAFGIFGARDAVVAGVSGFFYLLTVPVLYWLGARAFGRTVGLLAALVFALNPLTLEYAASGIHATLLVFLSTSFFLVVYTLAAYQRDREDEPKARLPRGLLLLAGLLAALLYLTDYVFLWMAPLAVIAVAALFPFRQVRAGVWMLVGLLVPMLPWMLRNALVAGNPMFGLRGAEVWMHTSLYPGYTAYRMLAQDLGDNPEVLRAATKRILIGLGQVTQALPQMPMVWVLAFFLPSLLFRFRDEAANALRRVMVVAFFGVFIGAVLFPTTMAVFVAVVATMLPFALAYLLFLVGQARLSLTARVAATALLAFGLVYPLLSDTMLEAKPQAPPEVSTAQALGERSQPGQVVWSDRPWVTAWYAGRPSVWLPATEGRVARLRARLAAGGGGSGSRASGPQWLMLTAGVQQEFSAGWQWVYGTLRRQNEQYIAAGRPALKPGQVGSLRAASIPKQTLDRMPLLAALDGMTWTPPPDGGPATTAVALLPPATRG